MKEKLKLIFLPFFLISISFISLYTFLNWLLFVKLHLIELDETIRNVGIPMFLLWIPILILMKPRIHLLGRKLTYNLAAWALILFPTIFAQYYMDSATGKLTELNGISNIGDQDKTKFYTVTNYFVSKEDVASHMNVTLDDKNLNISIYAAFPIYESRSINNKFPRAWLGIRFDKEIKAQLSEEEKQRKFEAFLDKTEENIRNKDMQEFTYLDRTTNPYFLNGYLEALKDSSKLTADNKIVLLPVSTPFTARNKLMPFWLCFAFFLGNFIWFLMLIKAKLENQPSLANEDPLSGYFIPKNGYFVTPILLNLNIFIFGLMVFSGAGIVSFNNPDLLRWGANYTSYVVNGSYWRLLASTFLHGGIIHLAGNMFTLIYIGKLLEPAFGKAKFLLIYLCTGVLASLTSVYWNTDIVSIGSSGAIFGLFGVFAAILVPNTLPSVIRTSLVGVATTLVVSNLLMGFTMSGIDNAAHVGGLISGFIFGLWLDKDKKTALKLVDFIGTFQPRIVRMAEDKPLMYFRRPPEGVIDAPSD